MVLMYSRTFSSPSSSIFSGVSATANSARVALLTPASVAWADSTTATSSVYGLRCSSSPFGSGLALRKRLNASRTSAAVHGLNDVLAGFFDPDLIPAFFPGLTAVGTRTLLARLTPADRDFDEVLRMIFGMTGVY